MRMSVVFAAIVVLGVVIVGLVAASPVPRSTSQPWQVVKENVTVTGTAAYDAECGVPGLDCPPAYLPSTRTASGLELILYEGNYYYLYNATNPITRLPFTTWLTNSTVYCVSGSQGAFGMAAPPCPQ
jgi:hypothetical protein